VKACCPVQRLFLRGATSAFHPGASATPGSQRRQPEHSRRFPHSGEIAVKQQIPRIPRPCRNEARASKHQRPAAAPVLRRQASQRITPAVTGNSRQEVGLRKKAGPSARAERNAIAALASGTDRCRC